MAGTWSRIRDIFRSKANKALDKMEDPRDTLDLSYEKQLEQLQKVRRGVADVATARKRIELQAQGLQKQADKLQGQAKAALQQGNEDLAREALARRAALGEQLAELKTQHDQISEQEQKLVQTSQELQARVERFRTQKETLKASYTAAEAQTKVGEAVSGISDSTRNAGATMQRAQDKIASMQARAGAIDELLASGALDDLTQPVDDIQKELDKVSSTSQVDNELAALKAELGTGAPAADAAALPAAEPGAHRRRERLMAISRNIKPDRGLTYRMLMTGFLFVVLYAVVHRRPLHFLQSLVLILIIGCGLLFCQYWFSAKIAMYAMHAKEVTPEQAPELHGVVDRLCALADMPKPKVAIATTDVPNAFATGRSPKAAVVCVTTGLLRRLDEPEVEAVLSHEISHVAHRDVAVMTIASGLGMIAGLLTRVMFYSELFGGGRGGGNNQQSQAALIEMIVLLVSVVVYFISFLLTMALSRYRELAADRSGALLIGRPSLLASALVKITGEMGRIPTKDLRAAEPFNAFFFAPAVANGATQGGGGGFSFGNLFRTHPTLERRLAQLEALEHQLGQAG